MSKYTQTKNNVKPLCCIKRVWNGLDDDDDDVMNMKTATLKIFGDYHRAGVQIDLLEGAVL